VLFQGIDYKNPVKSPADWLPLEPFDDTEYDCREPQEWIAYGEQPDGAFCPIPGKGLFKNDDGSGEWRPVLIQNYDEEREVYTGYWDSASATEYVELTRINLLFNAEDPRIFAQRVAQAHSERIYADSQIRYNFFIDYMPQQELPDLDTEQVSRILYMATASRYLKNCGNVETTGILLEVQLDFYRTMNQIIMEKKMEEPEEDRKDMVPANLTLPPKAPPKEVPYFGQVPIPHHDFPERFSTFCFNSLFIKDEVIKAMVEIRADCNVVLQDSHIFNIALNKCMRVDEFKQHQNSSISQIKFTTRELGWVLRLEKIIKNSFNDVGKGWFNIHETSKETYEFGKLKKFLTLVNFMMQDTVLNLCKNSVAEFVKYMLTYIPDDTTIVSTSEVHNKFTKIHEEDESEVEPEAFNEDELEGVREMKDWLNEKFNINKDPEPLFQLDLILKAGNLVPQYSNNPEEIVSKIKEVFEDGIKCLQEIPQLEPILLRHLFKTHGKKTIKAPIIPPEKPKVPEKHNKKALIDENTWLWEAYDELIVNLERAIIPLKEYVHTFEDFNEENSLNPDTYVKALDNRAEGEAEISPEELRADISEHKRKEEILKSKIPESVVVSMFQVNCKDIRNAYAGKYASIVDKEIKLIATKAKDKNYQITTAFGQIKERILKKPKSIEDLTDTKKFINEVGVKIEQMKKDIDSCMETYGILDDFKYEFSGAEQQSKWELYGAPQSVVKLMEQQNLALEKMKEQMIKDMEKEQDEFEETLDNLKLTVDGFNNYNKIEKFEEVAEIVDNLDTKIQQYIEDSRTYNQREFLVGKEQKDYSRLQQMAREFQPYSNLWRTTRTWHNNHKSWMCDPFEELDAPALDACFENSQKIMNQVVRYFRDRDQPQIFKISEDMKKQIDAFKPYVPLAVYLRKEGMKERHWDQISAKVGFDIRPEEDFTLTKIVEKGMLNHVEVAEEVGERANKEFNIEKSLAKMQADWESQAFLLPQFKNTPTNYIAGFDEAMNMLDEHIVTTQAMQFSPYKKPFVEEIEEWCAKLLLVQDTLDEWIKC